MARWTDLHEHIQTAMGLDQLASSPVHHRRRRVRRPRAPERRPLRARNHDSTQTILESLFGKARRKMRFRYQYDFGDGWEHEVTFEGRFATEPGEKYPRCIDGARACPPEDVGGTWDTPTS